MSGRNKKVPLQRQKCNKFMSMLEDQKHLARWEIFQKSLCGLNQLLTPPTPTKTSHIDTMHLLNPMLKQVISSHIATNTGNAIICPQR